MSRNYWSYPKYVSITLYRDRQVVAEYENLRSPGDIGDQKIMFQTFDFVRRSDELCRSG